MQALAQGGDGDDQLGGVAERRVEQAAGALARMTGKVFGGVAEPFRQRQDGEAGADEDGDMGVRREVLDGQGRGDQDQEPVERGLEESGPAMSVQFSAPGCGRCSK